MEKLTKEPNIVELKETFKQIKKTFFNWEKLKELLKEEIKHNQKEYDESFIIDYLYYAVAENWILEKMKELEKAE